MMTYTLKWHPKAFKTLSKLPKPLIQRVLEKFDSVSEDPFRFLEHFEGPLYKLRIGDYRALVDVNPKDKLIFVQEFDHRSRVYN